MNFERIERTPGGWCDACARSTLVYYRWTMKTEDGHFVRFEQAWVCAECKMIIHGQP